jgi:hypothetical protein
MKTTLLACIILAAACASQAASLPPADSFRLTVDQLVESSVCRVVQLKVEARPTAPMLEILADSEDGGSSIILAPTMKGKGRESKVIVASMLGDSNSVWHVTTLTQSGEGTRTEARRSYDLAPGTELKPVVVLTATNGVYKLNQPLVVGTRNGVPMRLVVGSWNWEQTASKK